jgi:hypothetical protein
MGKANDSQRRFQCHLSPGTRVTPVYNWIRKLQRLGLRPRLRVLELANDWVEAEKRLIKEARGRGERLLNVAGGGNAPVCNSETARNNGSKAGQTIIFHKGKMINLTVRKRLMLTLIKDGAYSNQDRQRLRECAQLRPDLFASFASISDREEDAVGNPINPVTGRMEVWRRRLAELGSE